jgi:hypothetical protein
MCEKNILVVQRFEEALAKDEFIDLTVYHIPVRLLEGFSEHVINPVYNGEVSEAETSCAKQY